MKEKRILIVMVFALFSLALGGDALANQCNVYPTSIATYFEGYGFVCAGYGMGCTECTDSSGGSCIANGSNPCEPGPIHRN